MTALSTEFGYLPQTLDVKCGPMSIATLARIEECIADVASCESVHDGWVFAPPQYHRDVFNQKTYQLPYASRIFGLPKTHLISHASSDGPEHLQFLVWCVGFFLGIRLTTTERGFLDATPVVTGKLTDFILRGGIEPALLLAELYWQQHRSHQRRTKRIEGIIHALFLSSNPLHLEFERFMYLYMALDGCYEQARGMHGGKSQSHAQRVEWTCQKFNLPVPAWAQPANSKTTISVARNDTLHEALFNEEPLGFAVFGGNQGVAAMPLQMQALTCRLLIALLGRPDASYVKSPVDGRQRYLLDIT